MRHFSALIQANFSNLKVFWQFKSIISIFIVKWCIQTVRNIRLLYHPNYSNTKFDIRFSPSVREVLPGIVKVDAAFD